MSTSRYFAALILFACCIAGCSPAPAESPTSPVAVRPTATKTAIVKLTTPPTASISCNGTLTGGVYPNIRTLNINDLYRCRPETRATINAIQKNGPFQFDQDDTIFSNREGILPPLSKNSYHEYTVITPGADTRGTRRILTAGDPNRTAKAFTKMYYTDDHYQTAWLVTGFGQ